MVALERIDQMSQSVVCEQLLTMGRAMTASTNLSILWHIVSRMTYNASRAAWTIYYLNSLRDKDDRGLDHELLALTQVRGPTTATCELEERLTR